MALLLAMYQEMRLIREKNQATFDLTKFTSKYNRVTKNIERVQKMYSNKIAKLDSQAKLWTSQAKSIFQQASGLALGMESQFLNPNSALSGQNAFTTQMMAEIMQKGVPGMAWNADKKQFVAADGSTYEFSDNVQKLYNYFLQNGHINSTQNTDSDGNKIDGMYTVGDMDDITAEDLAAFNYVKNAAQNQYYVRNQWLNNANTNYETNISIWLDAAKAELEAEQDEALEPLQLQEQEWELEKTFAEQKLERINADLEAYKNLRKEASKDAAPDFGLG